MSLYISDKIKIIKDNLEKGLESKDVDSLEAIRNPVEDLHNHIRESVQGSLRVPINELLRKLKKGEDLSGEDIRTIEKWMVGDAEHYVEIENNFNDWLKECKRIGNILTQYENPKINLDETQMFKLNTFLTDLEYTVVDVMRYIESMNRKKRFMDSIGTGKISEKDRKWLIEIIKRQLASPDI